MTVIEDGLLCACGNRGCWETVASTTHLVLEACRGVDGSMRAPLWLHLPGDPGGTLASWTAEEEPDPALIATYAQTIFRAAREGNPEAIHLVVEHAQHFARGIVNLINILDPQRIIIWGESVAAGEVFLETVRGLVKKRAIKLSSEMCEIVFSRLAHDVGLIGAGALVLEALFEGTKGVSEPEGRPAGINRAPGHPTPLPRLRNGLR